MNRRHLRARLDRLDGRSQGIAVTIELGLCPSGEAYASAFAEAWAKVPPGSTVYCFLRDLTEPEFVALVEGTLVQPQVMGIYLKPLAPNHLFDTSHDVEPMNQ